MRIALVIPDLAGGGAETLVQHLAEGYESNGHIVEAIYVRRGLPAPTSYVTKRVRALAGPFCMPGTLRAAFREFQPDVIHSHIPWAGAQTELERRLMRNPPIHVYTVHAHRRAKSTVTRAVERLVIRLADAVACVNGAWANEVVGRRVLTIPNGTPVFDRKGADRAEPFIWLGRFIDCKQPKLFLEALQDTELEGVMVGEGPLAPNLRHLCAAVPNVEVRGWSEEPFRLMRGALAVVFTSEFEGLPMVALEAMSAGAPLVVPDLPEFRYLLPDDYPFIYAAGDVPHLRAVLADVASDGTRANSIGRQLAQRHAEFFSIDKTVQLYLELFDSLRRLPVDSGSQ